LKKVIRLAVLLGLTFLATWSSAPKLAYALPLCDGLDGRHCSVPGRTLTCLWSQGGNGACNCDRVERIWECFG
jgi:hypothetical protein